MFRYITHPFATRHQGCPRAAVRLACVKHAASVQSEPGSNSSVQFLFWFTAEPVLLKVNHWHDSFRLCVSTTIFLKSLLQPPIFKSDASKTSQKPSTYTRRLFVCFLKSGCRSSEEVRIIGTKILLSTTISHFVLLTCNHRENAIILLILKRFYL